MKKLLATVALVGTLMIPGGIAAQTTVGAAAGYHTDLEEFGIGAYAGIPVPTLHENLSINPSFIYYLVDGATMFEVNGDAVFRFPLAENTSMVPFALAGINIFRTSIDILGTSVSSTDVGLNLGGGLAFPMASVTPVVGAKFEIQDGTGFLVFGGIGFPLGG